MALWLYGVGQMMAESQRPPCFVIPGEDPGSSRQPDLYKRLLRALDPG
jgi:hypothetical protein